MQIGDPVKTCEGIGKIIDFKCDGVYVEVKFERTNTVQLFNVDDVQVL